MDGYQRAALALHGLEDADRQWVLGRLPEPARERIGGMLTELRSLGIPADPALSEVAVAKPKLAIVDATRPDAPRKETPLDRLRAATPRAMRALLESEPDTLVAAFLAAGDWPWRRSFLATLPRARRVAIATASCLGKGEVPAALREALLAGLDRRLAYVVDRPRLGDLGSRLIMSARRRWSRK